jgi:hypothetical protein
VFFPRQTDRLVVHSGHPDYGRLLANAIAWTAGERLPVVTTDAPSSVHISVTEQADDDARLVVHLINYTSGYRRAIQEVVPLSDLHVSVRVGREVGRVVDVRTETPIDFTLDDGVASFVVDRLETYAAVAVE